MNEKASGNTICIGFRNARSGVHLARTIMLEELQNLLAYVENSNADKSDYSEAIIQDNCLSKRSENTRILTARHLTHLYALDPKVILFRNLQFFWDRDIAGQPLLALLCAYARDSILRLSTGFIMDHPLGEVVKREALENIIDSKETGRFSKATLKSTAQNINATWTKSGHLTGRAKKIRTQAHATPGSVSYALLLGYLNGLRGESIFKSEYVRLLDCSFDRSIELATEASRKGWIVLNRLGSVIEVLFPNLLSKEEQEWVHEQN